LRLLYLFFMKIFCLALILCPLMISAQTDVLEIKKNGINEKTYTPGMYLAMETIYDQWFEGTITAIRNDSVFLNGLSFHYKELKMIRWERKGLQYTTDGVLLMVAGAGVLVLGAVNGLYRGDPANEWYTTGSYITAGALLLGGYFILKSRFKKYKFGKKYSLEYIEVNPNKNDKKPF